MRPAETNSGLSTSYFTDNVDLARGILVQVSMGLSFQDDIESMEGVTVFCALRLVEVSNNNVQR